MSTAGTPARNTLPRQTGTAAPALPRRDDPLLQPLQIRHLRLRNRVMSTSHAAALDVGGMPLERYQRYHEEKARGGLALTMFGGSSMVSPDSSWGGGQINVSTDEIIPHLRQFSGRIHAHGAALMCQISHLGRRATSAATNWLPTVAPSAIRETRHRVNKLLRGDDDILRAAPDAVVVATGGLPDTAWLDGAEHCTTTWDVLANATAAKDDVIVYDGTGRHQAVSCALHLAELGRAVQFVTLDDTVGAEMEYNARVVYRKRFAKTGVRTLTDHSLVRVRPRDNRLLATFRHELTGDTTELAAAQVVVERGTTPVDEAFTSLRDRAANRGVTDIDALLAGRPQPNRAGGFELHRIGDAVASRGVHAAIYDAARLCMAF